MHTPGASSPLWEGPEPWVLSGWEAALSHTSLGAVALGDPGSHLLPSASRCPGQPTVPSSCVPPAGPRPGEQGRGTVRAPGEEGLWLYLAGQAPSLAAQRGQEQHPAGPGGSDHSSPLPAAQTCSSRQAPCGAEAKAGERAMGEELRGAVGSTRPSEASAVWERSLPDARHWRPSRPPALGCVWEALLPTVRSGSGGSPLLLGALLRVPHTPGHTLTSLQAGAPPL